MNKTTEHLLIEKAKIETQLEQEQHKKQRNENRIGYIESGDRKKRNHHLITRGAAVESIVPEVKPLTEVEFYSMMEHIDEHDELPKYQDEVLKKARETMSEDDIAYAEEGLRSPCTQEIAVFRAFAEIVEKTEDQIVVIEHREQFFLTSIIFQILIFCMFL